MVSVDPNLRHLGVDDPQRHVLALLDHFGLRHHSLVLCGYSLERLGQRFDVALVDGNHDSDYVRREIEVLVRVLPPGALLMLDDIRNAKTELPGLYAELLAYGARPLERIAEDDRIGVLRRTP